MKRLTTVGLQVLLSLAFLASAILKLAGAADDMREHLEIAPWFWILTALAVVLDPDGAGGDRGRGGDVGRHQVSEAGRAGGLVDSRPNGWSPRRSPAGWGSLHEHGPCRSVPGTCAGGGRDARGCLWVREAGRREAESVVGACRIEKSGRSAGQGSRKARDVA